MSVIALRALTVKQPWASLIIHGGKDVENRTWGTKHRGPLEKRSPDARPCCDCWDATRAGEDK